MMHNSDTKLKYYENTGYKFVSIPYKFNKFALGIILPTSNFKKVNTDTFTECINNTTSVSVNLYLPKFEQRTKLSLVNILKNEGMKSMFNEDADFSNMLSLPLCISDIIHECVIKLDEIKTEAAASTILQIDCLYNPNKEKVYEFKADHTFTYFIYHVKTDTILFTGIFDG